MSMQWCYHVETRDSTTTGVGDSTVGDILCAAPTSLEFAQNYNVTAGNITTGIATLKPLQTKGVCAVVYAVVFRTW